jgi:hypothetical protein
VGLERDAPLEPDEQVLAPGLHGLDPIAGPGPGTTSQAGGLEAHQPTALQGRP